MPAATRKEKRVALFIVAAWMPPNARYGVVVHWAVELTLPVFKLGMPLKGP